ncbi:hypothetical protein I4F81_001931 [Pyropia yezoensis]|uniref:Uncharacterized protein n=1 Tax=Pyropia yezoensis TaxID=2788 RepID=A0ACC3BN14_PYRYE|nr:hypothetical protein I4F81_001931 [Neopyropia yezoensis]
MAARVAVVVPVPPTTATPPAGRGVGYWAAAARTAVVALWPPRRRGCWTGADAGLPTTMAAAPPPRAGDAVGGGGGGGGGGGARRLPSRAAARVGVEVANARAAAADVAGAAVAILLVLFCGLPEDEELPGGEPLKGGWWATWGVPRPRVAPAAAAAAAAAAVAAEAPRRPAAWAIDPEADDPFHADLSPQWRWALAIHWRVARAAVSAAQAQPAGERQRKPQLTRRPSMPSICELSQLYADDASQSAPAILCS